MARKTSAAMTSTEKHMAFVEGARYWQAYVNLNGYAFAPTRAGIRQLSASLGLPAAHLRRQITIYLEA